MAASPLIAEETRRRRATKRIKRDLGHGNWKLVYADFMTVLMAFFLVTWILLWDLVSKRPEIDMACIQRMAADLHRQIDEDKALRKGAVPILIDLQPDSLRLTLLDNNQPMFQTGGAVLSGFAKEQFGKIASAVNMCPGNPLRIEGYTDATPYAGGALGYGNWELSAERANAARRELLSKEVDIKRIAQVLGYGDSVPSLPNDPTNPLNRRISITVLPKPDNASSPR